MQKNIETLLDALKDIEEPQHFLRFVASRIDWDAEKVSEAYEATLFERKAAKFAQEVKAKEALSGFSKEDAIVMLGGLQITAKIDEMIVERAKAKAEGDFARADFIREELKKAGVILEDGKNKTDWRRA